MRPSRYTEKMVKDCFDKGYWDSFTLSHYWERNAWHYADRELLADSSKRLTGAEVRKYIDRLALGLIDHGIQRDEIVVIQLPNNVEALLLRVACEKAGIIYLPALRALRAKEMESILKTTQAAGVVIPWQFAGRDHFQMVQEIQPNLPNLRRFFVQGEAVPEGTVSITEMLVTPFEEKYPSTELEKRRFKPDEVSWIAHTTGTTGMPKLVQYLAGNRPVHNKGLAELMGMTSQDIAGIVTPAMMGHNSVGYGGAPIAGAKVVMLEQFDAEEALKFIQRERVTVFGCSPALMLRMVRHPNFDHYDLSSVRAIWISGVRLERAVGREVEDKLQREVLLNAYGAMDCGAPVSPGLSSPFEVRVGTVGRPFAGARVRLVDETGQEVAPGQGGEVLLTGPSACDGYFQDPEATRKVWTTDGWFHTGDIGAWNEEGNLVIVGRKKDVIVRGGENVSPAELDDELLEHPKVAGVAVVGMPDPELGEKVCAYIMPKPSEELTFEDLISFLRKRGLASYKLPERIEIVTDFPMVGGGDKIDKKPLREDIRRKLEIERSAK